MITLKELINYYIDVIGMGEDEARQTAIVWGTSYLSEREFIECLEYSK